MRATKAMKASSIRSVLGTVMGLALLVGTIPTVAADDSIADVLGVQVWAKRFEQAKYIDSVRWAVAFQDKGLSADARAVQGILVFADLFKHPRFAARLTIDKPIPKGGSVEILDASVKYNQFDSDIVWLRDTAFDNMTVWFVTEQILYADGRVVGERSGD